MIPTFSGRSRTIAAAAILVLAGSSAASGQSLPADTRSRMFTHGSAEVWKRVREQFGRWGLKAGKLDDRRQVFITRTRPFFAKELKWVTPPALPHPYSADRVQFHVFVSPFAEPARLYIGSVLYARRIDGGFSEGVFYNDPALNQALMSALEDAVGEKGKPIPSTKAERAKLASELSESTTKDCAPAKGDPVTRPQKIKITQLPIIYPAPQVAEGKRALIVAKFEIREDGAVADATIPDPPPGVQFDEAVLGAVSLLRYEPTRLGACAVPTTMTYTVDFKNR